MPSRTQAGRYFDKMTFFVDFTRRGLVLWDALQGERGPPAAEGPGAATEPFGASPVAARRACGAFRRFTRSTQKGMQRAFREQGQGKGGMQTSKGQNQQESFRGTQQSKVQRAKCKEMPVGPAETWQPQ